MSFRRFVANNAGLSGDAFRFLLGGAANTLLTLAAFQLFVFVLSAGVSYLLAWLVGLMFAILLYPSQVFRGGRTDMSSRLAFGCVYIAVFVLGLLFLSFLERLALGPRVAILVVIPFTTVLNLVLGRLVLRRQ